MRAYISLNSASICAMSERYSSSSVFLFFFISASAYLSLSSSSSSTRRLSSLSRAILGREFLLGTTRWSLCTALPQMQLTQSSLNSFSQQRVMKLLWMRHFWGRSLACETWQSSRHVQKFYLREASEEMQSAWSYCSRVEALVGEPWSRWVEQGDCEQGSGLRSLREDMAAINYMDNYHRMEVEQLLEFCAYFTLVRNGCALTAVPVTGNVETKREEAPKRKGKQVRPKVEEVEPSHQSKVAVKRPKIQPVTGGTKKAVPKVRHEQPVRGHDLNYFINHIGSKNAYSNHRGEEARLYLPLEKVTNTKNNFATFGRDVNHSEYNKYSKKSNTDRPTISFTTSTTKVQPNSKWDLPFGGPSNWNGRALQRAYEEKMPYFDSQAQTPRQSGIMYSPVRREINPFGNSAVYYPRSPEQALSKSRSKLQRKTAEKPFYDASKLTPPRNNNVPVKQRQETALGLSKSYVDVEVSGVWHAKKSAETERRQPSTAVYARKVNDQERRQTSTTAAPSKTVGQTDRSRQQVSREVQLDDESEEYIANILQQRKAPTAIEVDLRVSDY